MQVAESEAKLVERLIARKTEPLVISKQSARMHAILIRLAKNKHSLV